MLRSQIAPAVTVAAILAAVAPAGAEDSFTTRIEPRAVYGATVTIEEGVRVFRPVPSERHVIVNPGGMAPLSLGYFDARYGPHYYARRDWEERRAR